MKKIKLIFLMFTLALLGVSNANATKVFATFGAPAGNGAWNAETQTYSWTAGWSNLMPIFTFANGELAEYTALHLTTSDYVDGPYRVCFMNGSTAVATIAFYSADEKNLVLSERSETKDIDLSKITAIQFGGASGAGSVKLDPTSVYLVKPASCNFGDDGKAHFSVNDLDVTGNVTIDYENKTVTSTGNGTISISLPNCDFTAVKRVDVTRSGDDICNTMAINDAVNGNLNTWYGSKYGCDFSGYQSKAGQVNKITWNVDKAGTMTISDIVVTADILTGFVGYVLPEGATDALSFNTAIASWYGAKVSYPTTFAVQGNFWGNNGLSTTNRVDLASADYISFVVTEGSTQGLALRVWVTDGTSTATLYAYPAEEAASVTNWGASYLIKTPGVYTVKVSDWKYISGIKADNNWGASPIVVVLAYTSKGATPAICDMTNPVLSLSGKGVQTSAAKEILANANATIIDAKGITGTGVKLNSANPNCIFLANAGALANTENVCVNGTINKLSIYDGKPFAFPEEATSIENASYNRNLTTALYTVCLPFAANYEGKAYEYKGEEGDEVTFQEVDGATLEAGKAYLAEPSFNVTGGSGALVTTPVDGIFKGTFEKKVLNSDASTTYYGFSNGEFVKVGSNVTVKPFRAYLEASGSAAKLNVVFGDATGISKIGSESKNNAIKAIYGADGAQKAKLTKGINVLKLQNGETVKVNIK